MQQLNLLGEAEGTPLFSQPETPAIGSTVRVRQYYKAAPWTGIIVDATPTTFGGMRYDVLPNDDCPVKKNLYAHETIHVYDKDIVA